MTVTIPVDRLQDLVGAIFGRAGCDAEEAARVAEYLVSANLAGHDSHGVLRTLRYIDWLESGLVEAGKAIEVVYENEVMAIVDGQGGLGQTVAPEAVRLGIDKARKNGAAIVSLKNAGHIGRVGNWAEMAAEAGMVSVHFVNARGSILVAPFGGTDRRFSTAPFCVGVPQRGARPLILDFATSVVAEGKVLVAAKGGKKLPEGALIDGDGRLTTDPVALYGKAGPDAPPAMRDGTGAIRAFGEHKGSGLALMCELLGGALTGNGTCGPPPKPFANGMLSIYMSVEHFDRGGAFADEVAAYVDYLKSANPADPANPVLVPGEPEQASEAERRANGVPLPDDAWASIVTAAHRVGMSDADIDAIAKRN